MCDLFRMTSTFDAWLTGDATAALALQMANELMRVIP